jgi:quercetin dioxygenase-like cupin family protein
MASYAAPYEKAATPVTGLTLEPQLENAWFRSFRLELAAGESSADISHGYPVAIVQVSEGLLHVSRADGITSELKAAGDWAWRTAGQPYQIHNKTDSPVAVVINEALR